jgi:pyrroloquinoline quinone biosynthesis protein B
VIFGTTHNLGAQGQAVPVKSEWASPDGMDAVFLVILGTVQDGGSPHIGCTKECCADLFRKNDHSRKVVSLGLIDSGKKTSYLFEATPDITTQMKALKRFNLGGAKETPDGLFLTHAHIGHYTGLMYLGKEAMNADKVKVYAMPRMKGFLENNGPWSQLVANRNILIEEMADRHPISLSASLKVTPLKVPHRDEYSETIGFLIEGPSKKALFIPDIDKWQQWDLDIKEQIQMVDYAFLDASFFDGKEIANRDISEIPHPFVIESMDLFKDLPSLEKAKIHFIHFNHTNPLLNEGSMATKQVHENGFGIARLNSVFKL